MLSGCRRVSIAAQNVWSACDAPTLAAAPSRESRAAYVERRELKPCEVVIVGSGFAGSLLARILAIQGYDVVLVERGTHPRFAIRESPTPLANLSLERLGIRYGMADCYNLATHGRWLAHFPEIRRGLKRGFTYYL